jgi:hypothetical protein
MENRHMDRTLLLPTAALVLTASLAMPSIAATKNNRKVGSAHVAAVPYHGVAYATGYGAINTQDQNDATAYLKARNDAKLDALRNLVMRIDHVRIDSTATNSDLDAKDKIKAEVHGFIDGAQIISERQIPVGRNMLIEVTVAVPLGPHHVPNVALASMPKPARIAIKPRPVTRVAAVAVAPPVRCIPCPHPTAAAAPPRVAEVIPAPPVAAPCPPRPAPVRRCVSGLIVDARGLGVDRDMAPKIRRENGRILWGNDEVNIESLIEKGLVTYAHSIGEAQNDSRAGDNPMIVRAIRRSGGPFRCDVVLGEQDAQRILRSNNRNEFLDHWSVVFVVDHNH